MKTGQTNAKIKPKSNWFKLISIIIIGYIFLHEDIRLHINIDSSHLPAYVDFFRASNEDFASEAQNDEQEKTKFAIPAMQKKTKLSLQKELERVAEEKKITYLKRFSDVAINERRKYGIPSSIILANALLMSTAGERAYTIDGKNHFGLSCSKDWAGKKSNVNGQCYRWYENSWRSFRDFSIYITSGKYQSLRKLGAEDYKRWAYSMERHGFYLDRGSADLVIKIIERYKLNELDVL